MAKEEKVKKYWELEDPKEFTLGINHFKQFEEHGKLQVYRVKEGTKRGITKGCTIELDQMSDDELNKLKELVVAAIDTELSNRSAKTKKNTKVKKAKATDKKKKKVKKTA